MADVTVLMAVFNAMPYLREAVESIAAQTHAAWQMVIVNDGSTDGTTDYLRSFGNPRIEVLHQANRGLGPALNAGLERCHTEFTARMDGDDVAHPTRLAEQIAFLRARPDVGVVGTQIEHLGSRRTGFRSAMATEHEAIYADVQRGRNQMYHPTIVCRTAILKEIGGYWPHPRGEEWDLFLRLGERTRLANLDRVLLSYRVLNGSMTGSSVAKMRSWVDYACECARRRRQGEQPIDYETFALRQADVSLWRRIGRRCEMHARTQYRLGLGEVLGERALVGALRLTWAGLSSPSMSASRISRMFRGLRSPARGAATEAELSCPDPSSPPPPAPPLPLPRPELEMIELAGLKIHRTAMSACVRHIVSSLRAGVGGWVMTPNVDILRRWTRSEEFRRLTAGVTLCIADGMPLVWASRLAGTPLPERVTGADLTRALVSAAADAGLSIFFLGGAPGSAEAAVDTLREAHPALNVAGVHVPPFGFENSPAEWAAMAEAIRAAHPQLIFVGLGSPKQERVIHRLQRLCPAAWWFGVGITFSFLGGKIGRAPPWMQRFGLEWLYRLWCEPRRLVKRYVIDDAPFALWLLADAVRRRIRGKTRTQAESAAPALSGRSVGEQAA